MEKHKCKFCLKNFSNGRALGGHMRSHMLNLPNPHKVNQEQEREHHHHHHHQLSFETETETETESASSSSEDDEEKSLFYELRENPRRSIRLVDPEISFAVVDAAAAASVVLQDRESETESSKNLTRRRSKRTRKIEQHRQDELDIIKKLKFKNKNSTEPASSISDTTTELEDVAFCLMMLSRDEWKIKEQKQQQNEFMFDEETDEESEEFKSVNKNRSNGGGKYKCETCKKVFRSYQALGGHRASHKKIKFYKPLVDQETDELQQENADALITTSPAAPIKLHKIKVHECPVCFRVFSSGQALGGHKRTHVTGSVAAITAGSTSTRSASASTKLGEILIDLNLPAPIDDDDISQIELSAVSDAEFVNHIKQ